MIDKLKSITNFVRPHAMRFTDVRFAGQVAFIVIVLLISWSGAKAIQTNYGLQKQVASVKNQDTIQQLENTNLALQNQYYQSNQYLELSARQNFGIALPGEKEIIVPKSVALSYTVAQNTGQKSSTPVASIIPKYQQNIQAWVNFFLHRQET